MRIHIITFAIIGLIFPFVLFADSISLLDGSKKEYTAISVISDGIILFSGSTKNQYKWTQIQPETLPESIYSQHRNTVVPLFKKAQKALDDRDHIEALNIYARLKGHNEYLTEADRKEKWGKDLDKKLSGLLQIDGKWLGREDILKLKGFVKKDGKWLSPAEQNVIETRRKAEETEKLERAIVAKSEIVELLVYFHNQGRLFNSNDFEDPSRKALKAFEEYKKTASEIEKSTEEYSLIEFIFQGVKMTVVAMDEASELMKNGADELQKASDAQQSLLGGPSVPISEIDAIPIRVANSEIYVNAANAKIQLGFKSFTRVVSIIDDQWESIHRIQSTLSSSTPDHLNSSSADESLRKLAESGDSESQNTLGLIYVKGEGVTVDSREAAKWFRKAAEQGLANAQFNLACCYDKGLGVDQDSVEAVKWFRKAAEQGLAKAQFNLACCYDKGLGVDQDSVEAVKWWRKAAELGNSDAQNNLGYCYDNGEGIDKNSVEAVKWFRKGANQGNSDAQFNLGKAYEKGKGVNQDSVEAVKWWRKAAEQGDANSQCALGVFYYRGEGVSKDDAEAEIWLRKAAEQGNQQAKENLRILQDSD
jgi:TPR repeat protein